MSEETLQLAQKWADHQATDPPQPVELRDLLKMKMPERRWLLEGFMQERDIAMIHAYRGVGKSRFAQALGVAVASGGSFLRFEAPEPRQVLLVDGELPREDLQKMLAQAVAASDSEPEAPLRVLSADLADAPLRSLATNEGRRQVEEHLGSAEFLILDNISTLFLGSGPENDSESWEKAQAWLLSLRRKGVATLLVHHDGKGGAQRGTSKREDVLSTVVQLKHPPDYEPSQGARFELKFTKSRGMAGDAVVPLMVTLETPQDGRPGWRWDFLNDSLGDRAGELKALGMSVRDIAKELEASKSAVHRALQKRRVPVSRTHAQG